MAHFAKVENGVVTNVIVAESDFIASLPDASAWIQTSYNTRGGVYYMPDSNIPADDQSKALRKNYAGIGYTYSPELDAFIPPQPFPSWTLNTQTCLWQPPVPAPDDGFYYEWDETLGVWRKVGDVNAN